MSLRQMQGRVQLAIKKVPPLFHALKWSRDTVRATFGPRRLAVASQRQPHVANQSASLLVPGSPSTIQLDTH